ncbi:cell division protein FtsL [Glaciecola sp. 1036]|uniref:cell division protein FtsL n=1 Tax=Alteromonadaceae TaxID=72275 RepID=UPI003D002C94
MSEKTTPNFNLLLLITADLSRHTFLLLMYLAVVGTALAVVVSTHKNRELLITHEQLIEEKDSLDVEWRHLIIEQNALTEHNRIERLVRERLNMRRPSKDDEVFVSEN